MSHYVTIGRSGANFIQCDGTRHRVMRANGEEMSLALCACPKDKKPESAVPISARSVCQGCGRKIAWGITEDNKRIPLDPTPPVYRIVPDMFITDMRVQRVERNEAMVNHFATCREANRFSASNNRTKERT